MIIKSVGVLSCAKLAGVLYAVWGLVAGIGIFLATASSIVLTPAGQPGLGWFEPLFGPGAIVILPIGYGLMGFVGGALAAWVFNRAANVLGGLELDIGQSPR